MAERLPLFPLETVLFPGALLPLHIFEPRYRRLINEREHSDPVFGVVLTRSGREVGEQPEVYEIGVSATLVEIARLPDGRSNLLVAGSRRFRIVDAWREEDLLIADVAWLDDLEDDAAAPDVAARLRGLVSRYIAAFSNAVQREVPNPELPAEPVGLAYAVAAMFPFAMREKQVILEAATASQAVGIVEEALRRDLALLTSAGIAGTLPLRPERRFGAN